jgi:hypothetical protein
MAPQVHAPQKEGLMAKVYVMDFPGGTAAQYDAVMVDMDLQGQLPAGARFHSAGPSPTGWQVIDCWDDPAAFDRFAEESIGPITARHGLQPPAMRVFDVEGGIDGPEGTPEVAMLGVFPGLTGETFLAMDVKIRARDEVPDGLLRHVNGPHPDGWYVADLWASEDQRTRFLAERVAPVAPAGVEPRFELLPVHASILTRAQARA